MIEWLCVGSTIEHWEEWRVRRIHDQSFSSSSTHRKLSRIVRRMYVVIHPACYSSLCRLGIHRDKNFNKRSNHKIGFTYNFRPHKAKACNPPIRPIHPESSKQTVHKGKYVKNSRNRKMRVLRGADGKTLMGENKNKLTFLSHGQNLQIKVRVQTENKQFSISWKLFSPFS